MKSEGQTKNEYLVSKILFKKFLRNSDIRDKLGLMFITNVETFYKNNVEVHEKKFCFHERRGLLHFEEYSNSVIEGVKSGIKKNLQLLLSQTLIWLTLQ